MPRPLRYTGEFPPINVFAKYPNWDYALDEEGQEGQDETTIRPEEEQTFITRHTGFTAADAWFATGLQFPALAEILPGRVCGINVFEGSDSWRVYFHKPSGVWCAFVQVWLPENERR